MLIIVGGPASRPNVHITLGRKQTPIDGFQHLVAILPTKGGIVLQHNAAIDHHGGGKGRMPCVRSTRSASASLAR